LISDLAVQSLSRTAPTAGAGSSIGEALRTLQKEIGYLEKRVAEDAG
jgi:hypothetical protein